MTLSSDSPASITSATRTAHGHPVTAASTRSPPGMSAGMRVALWRASGQLPHPGLTVPGGSGAGCMTVAGDGSGDGDSQQSEQPGGGFEDGTGGGAAETQGPQG